MYSKLIPTVELALPYVVIHTGSENSVPRARGEISTGYRQAVAVQLGDGLAVGLLQAPAVVNTHLPANKTKTFIYYKSNPKKRTVIRQIYEGKQKNKKVVPAFSNSKVLSL